MATTTLEAKEVEDATLEEAIRGPQLGDEEQGDANVALLGSREAVGAGGQTTRGWKRGLALALAFVVLLVAFWGVAPEMGWSNAAVNSATGSAQHEESKTMTEWLQREFEEKAKSGNSRDLFGWRHDHLALAEALHARWAAKEIWPTLKEGWSVATGYAVDDAKIDAAGSPSSGCSSDDQCVLQGFGQIKNSVLKKPELPTKEQVAAACPQGKDCTPSAVIDINKHVAMDGSAKGLDHRMGICYNAPYYYAEACIANGLSPNARAAIVTPNTIRGKTCEEIGYQPWPAFYADPFYGWANNVSLFVSWGTAEWVPFIYLISACQPCLESLMLQGWGRQFREKNPQCDR